MWTRLVVMISDGYVQRSRKSTAPGLPALAHAYKQAVTGQQGLKVVLGLTCGDRDVLERRWEQ